MQTSGSLSLGECVQIGLLLGEGDSKCVVRDYVQGSPAHLSEKIKKGDLIVKVCLCVFVCVRVCTCVCVSTNYTKCSSVCIHVEDVACTRESQDHRLCVCVCVCLCVSTNYTVYSCVCISF